MAKTPMPRGRSRGGGLARADERGAWPAHVPGPLAVGMPIRADAPARSSAGAGAGQPQGSVRYATARARPQSAVWRPSAGAGCLNRTTAPLCLSRGASADPGRPFSTAPSPLARTPIQHRAIRRLLSSATVRSPNRQVKSGPISQKLTHSQPGRLKPSWQNCITLRHDMSRC